MGNIGTGSGAKQRRCRSISAGSRSRSRLRNVRRHRPRMRRIDLRPMPPGDLRLAEPLATKLPEGSAEIRAKKYASATSAMAT